LPMFGHEPATEEANYQGQCARQWVTTLSG
jgi:hypothetical protein